MKIAKSILKGVISGSVASLLALLVMGNVMAHNNAVKHLVIPARPTQNLTVNSSPDEVLGLMLDSDQTWDSLDANYVLTNFDSNSGQTTTETQHFMLDKKGELARVEITGTNPIVFVRGTSDVKQERKLKKTFYQISIPKTFKYDNFNPRNDLAISPYGVHLHPFGKALPTGYYDFLYPTGIAQSLITNAATGLETIQVIGEDQVAGRKTVVISRMPKNHLYWVDVETGIILRVQYIGNASHWQVQFEAQNIAYDIKIPASIFQYTPSKDAKRLTTDEYRSQP